MKKSIKQTINIDALLSETWLMVAQLRYGATTADGHALYNKGCKQVESVRATLEKAGYDAQSIDHITYAQCALLDETVMGRKFEQGADEGQRAWRVAPLQARYFGSLYAGEALYDRITQALQEPSSVPAVLTCYQRVLSLGFHGLYGGDAVSQSRRDETLSALNERVAPLDHGISLVVGAISKRRHSLLQSVWFWIALTLVLTAMIWWGGHVWLQALLAQSLPELP